ncbi:hypothetical protein RJ641_009019 [Dillenia turbinata]|uniref:adenylate kinase n=1 Tax=Dillenia turbinata TaxID=194707 RepID=A0AAN8Z8R7_9MAGN
MSALIPLRSTTTALRRLAPAAMPLLRLLSRSLSSAASAQLQFDDYAEPMMDSECLILGRGVQWVFIGNPSVKKHLYAEKLSKLLEVPHISMSSLVRQELSPNSSLYKEIATAVNKGKIVPEDIIFGLLSKRLEDGYNKGQSGFILNGIPRTRLQAEILDQLADIDLVINFKCTENEDWWLKGHSGGVFSHCGSPSLGTSGSTSFDVTPHNTHGKLSKPCGGGALKEKINLYEQQSKPVEDYYRRQKKLLEFQVRSAPRETWQGLLAALHLQNCLEFEQHPVNSNGHLQMKDEWLTL